LRDGARAGTDWQVTRTISEPTEVWKLLGELAVLAGAFIYPLPDGRLTISLFDAAATPAAVLDARELIPDALAGGQEELFTRQVLYYDPPAADPGDNAEDYDKGYILQNSTAETAWGESAEKEYFDKWAASAVAIAALAARRDTWYANPTLKTALKQLPPRLMGLQPGQLIQLDQLQLPCAAASWPGIVDGTKFLIMAKKVDPLKALIDLELMEVV
jgi:hypothetical protein